MNCEEEKSTETCRILEVGLFDEEDHKKKPVATKSSMSIFLQTYYSRPGRKILLFGICMAIVYLLFTGHGKLKRKHGKFIKKVTYSNKPIRTSEEILLELGTTCHQCGSKKGIVHNRHAVVLDAGSTGSRVHVYEFQCCGDKLMTLADEVFEEVKPGLSSYWHDPLEAARSLGPLIQRALDRIPPFMHSCTPLVLKATAGLRLLPAETVTRILEAVVSWLRSHPFLLGPEHDSEKKPVSVMDGSEEGVLAWVTVNFLKRKIGSVNQEVPLEDTSIVMDLGGGSTQIVFAIPNPKTSDKNYIDPLKYPDYYYQLRFHGEVHYLYQHSYLGFGLIEARKRIKEIYVKTRFSKQQKFACFPKGISEDLGDQSITGDSGGFDRCIGVVERIFDMDADCGLKPCSFNGIHQPPFPRPKNGKLSVVIFSYFFDRLIPLGLESPITLKEIRQAGEKLCSASLSSNNHYGRLLQKNHQWCLDVAYIYTLLSHGYKVSDDTSLTVTKQVEGYEAGWALGSALKLIDQHANSCPVLPPSVYY